MTLTRHSQLCLCVIIESWTFDTIGRELHSSPGFAQYFKSLPPSILRLSIRLNKTLKVYRIKPTPTISKEFRDRATKLSQTKTQKESEVEVEACAVEGEALSIDKIRALQMSIINSHYGDDHAAPSSGFEPKVDSNYNTDEDKSVDRSHNDGGSGSTCDDGGGVGEGSSDSSPFRTLRTSINSIPITAEDKESPTKSLTRMASKISDIDISLDDGVRRQLAAKEVSLTSPSRQAKNDVDAISSMGSASLPILDSVTNMHRGLGGTYLQHFMQCVRSHQQCNVSIPFYS